MIQNLLNYMPSGETLQVLLCIGSLGWVFGWLQAKMADQNFSF